MQPTNAQLTAIYNAANSIAEGRRPPISSEHIFAAMRAAMKAAREECAKVCDEYHYEIGGSCKDAASAIRALNGEKE